ncbi:VWA domain-containing protein [Halorubrum rubrum]|uniref:VWA domain-containing protein n=1 Tax=Halorubrum rubrum TaxID=1126240 RepID=A0ABD5QZF3_9EURY|nr:vWA domain-containing protein [Halorubrum rubrum]
MSNHDTFELSRRKALASLGAVGIASAGAGLGTSAYFSDEESFEGNALTAGELDLKVDWEEHYWDDFDVGVDVDHVDSAEEVGDDQVGLPDPENPMIAVSEEDLETFMDGTAIEAFPDPNDDGVQEMSLEEQEFSYQPCEHGADMAEHLDPTNGYRSDTDDTMGSDGTPLPLVNLDDVKPGDFGELTLSLHLCDNPGYVWLQAADVNESGGANPEPEREAEGDDENDPDLAENVRTAWWYDPNGNNVIDTSIGEVDVMIAVDTSGSLGQSEVDDLTSEANDLANDLDATGNARVGGLSFGNGAVDDFTALADGPVQFSGLSAGGNTPMPAALDVAAEELSVNGRSNAETFIVMFTDGGPNYPNAGYDEFPIDGGYTPGDYTEGDPSNAVVEDAELCETAAVADAVRADHRILAVGINDAGSITGNSDANVCADGPAVATLKAYLRDHIAGDDADYYSAAAVDDIGTIRNDILENVAMTEEVFHRGTLADDLEALADGNGIPLDGDRSTEFDELADDPDDENRECFDPGVTSFVGFAWWLPREVGNEVQGDTVSFDLGFYAEQCRHNDGSGQTMNGSESNTDSGTTGAP